ncbi:galactosylgalactosylxylosylprotein 3-beta-glucuronosyltransferase S isoform X1 [Anopheles funestus]|uniref:galactosylgalactosylxylosylprotein 3-beta-glucuronosyltransferase S isoform X1 n=1 Tax=Anopheles funestus TaxID=62324 RepID=UPI0020C7354E|nr:galactosylgalactosylxylosylprotein 3-beta-glucuronosyltransferase S isoform X1 [Anopheles funestus]XP_049276846.1 galactosylgalactosylxylosylprotein 3-beta-glucuronosyltransferase S isoform X1 [Anopheles funestus]XP_049276847.1 galactosylgalactosylxylosylprotein 3-beta-glucuronosyltransferase S isoform X1 [Anopheles funestus]XP_049276848.1 galactosylgalactosylxylosylprotein 3-beta-glucuronosyltransferase S isoform X1 [Anopheles funestus]
MAVARTSSVLRQKKILKIVVPFFLLLVVVFVVYNKDKKHESEETNVLTRLDLPWRSKKGFPRKEDYEKEYPLLLENEQLVICYESNTDHRKPLYATTRLYETTDEPSTTQRNHQQQQQFQQQQSQSNGTEPVIFFVTPTYPRREQIAEIIRLGQTLMHVPRLHWIVADDTSSCSATLNSHIRKFGIPYTQLASPMPEMYRARKNAPRGVANRRAALNWIRQNQKKTGVLYFGDDDNTFDLKLFSEIRYTKKVSMFPVGLIGDYAISTPIVRNGRVEGFFDSWPAKRKWPVDMAGFAVSLEYLALSPNATMPFKAGYEEDEFLKSIGLKLEDIEPKARNCTEILVWHTQTKSSKSPTVRISMDRQKLDKLNLGTLLSRLESMGVNHISESEGTTAQAIVNGSVKPLSFWFS